VLKPPRNTHKDQLGYVI